MCVFIEWLRSQRPIRSCISFPLSRVGRCFITPVDGVSGVLPLSVCSPADWEEPPAGRRGCPPHVIGVCGDGPMLRVGRVWSAEDSVCQCLLIIDVVLAVWRCYVVLV